MPLLDILALVTARLEAVESTRNVYNFKRLSVEQKKFKALFQDEAAKVLHTWFVVREGSSAKDDATQTYQRTHDMVLMGYYAVNDAGGSELAFNQVIEDICAAFDPIDGRTYDNEVHWSEPLQIEGPTTLMFGTVLCHAVKLSHKVIEWPLS